MNPGYAVIVACHGCGADHTLNLDDITLIAGVADHHVRFRCPDGEGWQHQPISDEQAHLLACANPPIIRVNRPDELDDWRRTLRALPRLRDDSVDRWVRSASDDTIWARMYAALTGTINPEAGQ